MSKKKIVIAGGTGLIGRSLALHSQTLGHEVVTLSRRQSHHVIGRAARWDGRTVGPWKEELVGADIVVNLCGANIGEGRWTPARKDEIRTSRIQPAQCLIAALDEVGTRPKLLQASAVGFYGTGDTPMTETDEAGGDFLAELAIEWEAQTAAYPGPWVTARFGVILSPKGGVLPRLSLPFKLFVGGPLGSGNQWFSWVTLDDAVRAVMFALDTDMVGPVNVVAPNPVTNRELARTLGTVLHRPGRLPTPAFALRTLLGEQADLLLEGQRVLPQKLLEYGFNFDQATVLSALQALLESR